jgi:hypothetical protein
MLDVQILTPLEEYLSKHRDVKSLVPFSTLNPSCRNDFYDQAPIYYIEKGAKRSRIFLHSNLPRVRSV